LGLAGAAPVIDRPTAPVATRDWRTDPRPGDTIRQQVTGERIRVGGRTGDRIMVAILGPAGTMVDLQSWAIHTWSLHGRGGTWAYLGWQNWRAP
jgi:hypothetical protein